MIQTAERVSQTDLSDNYVYQRSLLAYHEAAKMVSGKVLELGTGSGYGLDIISPKVEEFTTLDKFKVDIDFEKYGNVKFVQMTIPPLAGIADNTFDYVITFQVIEHIVDDTAFVSEIHRVLKKGGKLIVTTPNKKMSLTRNPWHIREYTVAELDDKMRLSFPKVEKLGVYGNEKVMEYFEENRRSVEKITRFDIFNLQYRLPRQLLQIPFDVLNRYNRRKMLKGNTGMVTSIKMSDYFVDKAKEDCLDLFYVAEK